MDKEQAKKHEMWKKQLLLQGYVFERTCYACPEQYDVKDQNGSIIAYLRLRHGSFTVSCPDVGGDVIYEGAPNGDGIFDDDERMKYLSDAVAAIQDYYFNRKWDEVGDW